GKLTVGKSQLLAHPVTHSGFRLQHDDLTSRTYSHLPLQQMALSFIALRLNVSSETADASHQALLQYIRPGAQNQMKVILAEEAKRIKNDNVNSAFFQTSVRVWPQYGRVEIRGVLKTWIGDSKPFTDIKHYILILKRENGVTWLDNFGETDDEKK
ncbi:type IV conjugative transfer system protein TraE, partial [Escherichia coli]